VNGEKSFDRFELYKYRISDHNIRTITAVKLHILGIERDRLLPLEPSAAKR
jgi:hypothetical protein